MTLNLRQSAGKYVCVNLRETIYVDLMGPFFPQIFADQSRADERRFFSAGICGSHIWVDLREKLPGKVPGTGTGA